MLRYQIAIYIRLSKEDDRCRDESNSITMQRILLRSYVGEHFTNYDLQEFCDDGYTGTNLNRPGMQNMLEGVRKNEIQCIIVKDFSRFARDYIELGSYLEQIFPFLGVRFISINDRYDSDNAQGSIAGMDVNFKNLTYDLYSRDLSEKVRSALAIRKEQGQYVSGNSPFGYEKDPKDRHALVVARDEAEVVRRIYSLTLEGYTSVEIARLLNETHVKTPMEFKREKGTTGRLPKGGHFLWSSGTICRILRNEIYIGNIVQKKYTKAGVGGKTRLNPREEWLTSYNHHEPIVEREVFEQVQKGRGKRRNPQHREAHPLTGKLVCGCCRRNLRWRSGLKPYFSCPQRYSNAMEHCVDQVNAMLLEQYVLYKLQEKLQADGELERLCLEAMSRLEQERKEMEHKRSLASARIQKLRQRRLEAYQDYACGRTDHFCADESMTKSIGDELAELNESVQRMEKAYSHVKDGWEAFCGGSRLTAQLQKVTDHFIDKILVYDEQHIEICWKEKVSAAEIIQKVFAVM